MNIDQRLLRAALRREFDVFLHKSFRTLEPATPFRSNWHLDALRYHLGRVARGECRRLIVNVPPRSMKSICASVAFPAWLLGRDPTKKIMCVSYGRELVRKHSLDFRTIVESPWYRLTYPRTGIEGRRQRDTEMTTAANGYRFASAMGGGILGRGADIIIIDDPIKPQDAASDALRRRANELYDNSIYTRLNQKAEGAIVIVMQRLHEDDLVGHVLEKEDWEIVAIPAIEMDDREYQIGPRPEDIYFRRAGQVLHPEREPREILDLLQRNLGSLSFSAQYQQQPLPQEGNYVKRQWLRYYDEAPAEFDLVVASWDTASTDNENSD
jgi:hypothetical protein